MWERVRLLWLTPCLLTHIVLHIYLFLLTTLMGAWYNAGSSADCRLHPTDCLQLTNWAPGLKTSFTTYFLDAHTFSFWHNSLNSFPLFFVYLKTQVHILFIKSTLTGCQKSIFLLIIFFKMFTCKHFLSVPFQLSPHPQLTKNTKETTAK